MDSLLNAGLTVQMEKSTYLKTFATLAGAGLFIIIAYFLAKKMSS